jgi:hypothetical protein
MDWRAGHINAILISFVFVWRLAIGHAGNVHAGNGSY